MLRALDDAVTDRRRQFVGRRTLQPVHQMAHAAHLELVLEQRLGIAARVTGDVAVCPLRIRLAEQAVAPRQRVQGARGGNEEQTVAHQVEFVDDLWPQQRNKVGEHAEPETREGLLAAGGAADLGRGLQHHDVEAGTGKVGRGNQTVVAGADNDRIGHSSTRGIGSTAVLRAGLKNGRRTTRARARRRP